MEKGLVIALLGQAWQVELLIQAVRAGKGQFLLTTFREVFDAVEPGGRRRRMRAPPHCMRRLMHACMRVCVRARAACAAARRRL